MERIGKAFNIILLLVIGLNIFMDFIPENMKIVFIGIIFMTNGIVSLIRYSKSGNKDDYKAGIIFIITCFIPLLDFEINGYRGTFIWIYLFLILIINKKADYITEDIF